MIRVRLAPAAIERVAVAYSPLTECLLSLRLLLKPALHPLHRHWARALRSLPPPLLAAIDKLAFAFTDDVPVFVAGGTGGSPPFAAELERLRSMPPAAIRYQFTRGLHHGALTQAQLNRSAVRRRLLEAAGRERTAGQEQLELVLERPQVFLAGFSSLLPPTSSKRSSRSGSGSSRCSPRVSKTPRAGSRTTASSRPCRNSPPGYVVIRSGGRSRLRRSPTAHGS